MSTTAIPGPAGEPAPVLPPPPAAPTPLSAVDIASLLGRPRPTDEQRRVIEAPMAPLLVVAGAGSGKTETMAARVVWLVANDLVAPDRVLGLTFTRKAAGELADRVRARLEALAAAGMTSRAGAGAEDLGDPTISTYHAYAGGVVADHGLRLGVEPDATLLGEAAAYQLASSVVEGWDGPLDLDAAPSTVTEAVLAMAGECSEHLVELADVEAYLTGVVESLAALPGKQYADVRDASRRLAGRRTLLPLVRRYAERKAAAGVLDFGDQVALAARLAGQAPAVAAIERARFSAVLLDEYQDTSHAQLVLLRELFGDGHAVTAVGDPHQSIYGWRGASAGNLAEFPRQFPAVEPVPHAEAGPAPAAGSDAARGPDPAADPAADPAGDPAPRTVPAAVLALSTSWRNDVAVLEAANVVAAPLRAASPVPAPPLGARPDAGPGRVVVQVLETEADEAGAVADLMASVRAADAALPVRRRRTAAVLCRKRSQLAAPERALRARGVPVVVVGLGGLLERPEVLDVLATLRVLHDASRGDALLRLLTGPRWRLGAKDLDVLAAWAAVISGKKQPSGVGATEPADIVSLAAALDDLPPPAWGAERGRALSEVGRERLERAGAWLTALRRATSLPLPELLGEVERALGLDVELAARPGTSPQDARTHLDALTHVAVSFDADTDRPSLGAFLAWLDAAAEREQGLALGEEGEAAGALPDPGVVTLMTCHAAKGLEFDVVAVPGMVEGTLPSTPRTSRGWLSGAGSLPYPLRGDAASLPELGWEGAGDGPEAHTMLGAFVAASLAHAVEEERRLAYVAMTRARSTLLLTGAWWGSGKKPRQPSRFLLELADAGAVEGGPLPQAPDAPSNPLADVVRSARWPLDPLGDRRAEMERAAAAVRAARASPVADGLVQASPVEDGPVEDGEDAGADAPAGGCADGDGWEAEVGRLLAERDGAAGSPAGGGDEVAVALPAHLSASRLVQLAAGPAALALAIRRPVPVQPRASTRRGTRFHAWLEQRYSSPALLDLDDELLGDAEDDDASADASLAELTATFEASEWADRTPIAVEVDLEAQLAGLVVRCRVDAVFAATGPGRAPGSVDVVDWKTGKPPTGSRARAAAVQLAVYRLAWARRHGVPLETVGAAFFYAATGVTSRPADLLDEAGLEALVTRLPSADE